MDRRAVDATRAHYDNHSRATVSQQEAIAQRDGGVSLPLKRFHNTVKRQMINRFAYRVGRLMDMACGRGGDLHKWADAEVGFVKGVDLSPGEIAEARTRYEGARQQREQRGQVCTNVEFEDTDQLGLGAFVDAQPYDTVTCMFAIHYFFASESALKTFMRNVADNLKDGGYFFGTCPDGKRILALLNQQKSWVKEVASVHARWQGAFKCFGSAYSMAIADTVTEGHEIDGRKGLGSYEYLVFRNVMEGVAAQFNLFPVLNYGDPEMDGLFLEEDRDMLFKHFKPDYPHSPPGLEEASGVNVAFCFQKREGGKDEGVTLPPLPPPHLRGRGGGGRGGGGRGGGRGGGGGNGRGKRPYEGGEHSHAHSRPRYA
eukprot:jgi/Tetstr1/427675/TSEL_017800.t1